MGYYYLTRETVTINGCTVDSYYRTDGDHTGAFGIKSGTDDAGACWQRTDSTKGSGKTAPGKLGSI